tara:strand:+ start:9080 stop:10876 length:1797 start_codon:yes stop_codon:yes gene_type:complete
MSDQQKKIVPINYTNREFETIRDDLLDIAERFYPDTFQDFSEASFGSLMIDSVAYVADQLSFYLDYNVNESFLDTAYQYSNVIRQGRTLGYKSQGRPSTYGSVALYVVVPASSTGIGPDSGYIPVLKRGSSFTSTTGLNYVLTENVDFSKPENVTIVARVDTDTGAPTYYAIKAYGNVVSGKFKRKEINVGGYERFKKVVIGDSNVSEVVSVYDSEGKEYFEVDYLAQDIVFKELSNTNFANDNVPSILKPMIVSRKYVVEYDSFGTSLQFGSGRSGETGVIADPQSVAAEIYSKTYTSDVTFDPSRLSKNRNLGVVPENTTLSIVYRTTNPANSNLSVSKLNSVSSALMDFVNRQDLVSSKVNEVIASVEVENERPIMGDVSLPSTGEIKRRIFDTFPTQNRAVTQSDYENIAYRMPAKFGSIKRCSVQQDQNSAKRNLNMYVVSEDEFGKLLKTNNTIKNNLKTWLNHYRMMNDTVDIIDPYIINLGISFIIRPNVGVDRYTLLDTAIAALKQKYSTPYFIGEPLYITDVFDTLKSVTGVLDVVKVKVTNQSGPNYSGTEIEINKNMSPDGTYLIAPKNAIFEIKFPDVDIVGKIR